MIPKERPKVLHGLTHCVKTDCGNLYLSLNYDENSEIIEVIPRLGKPGNCVRNLFEQIGILYSILLQSGIGRDRIKEMMKKHFMGTSCGAIIKYDSKTYLSCPDVIASLIYEEKSEKKKETPPAV